MKRRSFLALLGLAPLLAKSAAAEKPKPKFMAVPAKDAKYWSKMETSYGTLRCDDRIEAGSLVSLVGHDKVEPCRQGSTPIGIVKESANTEGEAIVLVFGQYRGNVR